MVSRELLSAIHTWEYTAGGVRPYPWQVPPTSLDEASLRLPRGVYTTFRTYAGCRRVIGLQDHLTRLEQSAAGFAQLNLAAHPALAIDQNALRGLLRQILGALQQEAAFSEARVRISMDLSIHPGTIHICVQALRPLPTEVYSQGVRLASSALQRENPEVKGTNFIEQSRALRQHLPAGIFELLLLNDNNEILEGMTSNFFAMRENILYTAATGILAGVTRKFLLIVAGQAGIAIQYEPVHITALGMVEEAFITSSSRGVVPVVQINDQLIRDGKPGAVTRALGQQYNEYVVEQAEFI